MPKPHTLPPLFNDALQINISKLKGWGYLNPNQSMSGTLNWSINDEPAGSISIAVNTYSNEPYLDLDYKFRGEPRNYRIRLVSIPSNLGKGEIWYFLCPNTNKRCRILYSIGGYFLHREAFEGCMYESQTNSKRTRQLVKTIGSEFKLDELYSQLYKKHLKKTYRGKPTKKYDRINKMIQSTEAMSFNRIK